MNKYFIAKPILQKITMAKIKIIVEKITMVKLTMSK
jgi:hypothetical protein